MNTILHANTHASGRPIRFFIIAEQVSAYAGTAALQNGLPQAD